ncbi:MAG: hypothetical protein K0Q95_1040 [Bacteroidota bacterium]|jgi:hypothetical protein|nr:hypothetical protein [Bacteroidota bacterium]
MKKVYLLVLLNSLFINLGAQNFDWAKREGYYEYDYGYGLGTDNSGNVYVAGKYEQSGAMFSGTSVTCEGNHDMYLAKYDAAGSLIWIRTAGGVLGDYAHDMACDKTSAIYVAGEIEGGNATITFSNSPITLTAISDNDIFVAKYDLNGTLLWAKSAGGGNGEKALGVTYDAAGNVYICGQYKDAITFNGTTTLSHNGVPGSTDIFIAKYDSNGNFIWAKSAGGPERDEALSIQCNSAGEVVVCGLYSNGAVFGSNAPLSTPNTPTGHYMDGFVAKYAADGTLLWVKTISGDYDDVAWSLSVDNNNKIYVSGEFNAYVNFGATALPATQGDAFVACYDNNGTNLWAVKGGGPNVDRARGIATDGNKIFITGQFGASSVGSTATFGSTSVTAVDSSDIFIAGLDMNGNFLWSKGISGAADAPEYLGYESGNAVLPDGNKLYVTGAILDGGTFGPFNLTGYAHTDMFLAKLDVLTGITEEEKGQALPVYPNPNNGNFSIDLRSIGSEKADYSVINYLGETVLKGSAKNSSHLNVDISTQPKGIYMIEVKAGEKQYQQKIVIQ